MSDAQTKASERESVVEELAARLAAIAPEPAREAVAAALEPAELRVSSQNGEDGVIAEILRRIGSGPTPFFVGFGVEDGSQCNCIALAHLADWPGLFIEVNADMYGRLADRVSSLAAVRAMRACVTPGNVDAVFAGADVPAEPSVVSIDVDGVDAWIWRALRSFRPRLRVIEYNAALDPAATVTAPPTHRGPWDGTDYFGASLGALERIGAEKGYRLVHTDLAGVNALFVRSDLAEEGFPRVEAVARRPPRYPLAEAHGGRHPVDPLDRPYVDLLTGEEVAPPRGPVDPVVPPEPPIASNRGQPDRRPLIVLLLACAVATTLLGIAAAIVQRRGNQPP